MVSDRFWMIYGIAETPSSKCVKSPPPPGGQVRAKEKVTALLCDTNGTVYSHSAACLDLRPSIYFFIIYPNLILYLLLCLNFNALLQNYIDRLPYFTGSCNQGWNKHGIHSLIGVFRNRSCHCCNPVFFGIWCITIARQIDTAVYHDKLFW